MEEEAERRQKIEYLLEEEQMLPEAVLMGG